MRRERGRRALVVAVVGAVLFAAALGFLIAQLAQNWTEFTDAVASMSLAWLAASVGLAVAAMVFIALGWYALLSPDRAIAPSGVLGWYFAGEIGKYLPGGIWPVVGRAELATRAGVRRPFAYGSVIVSLIGLFTVGAWMVVVTTLGFTRVDLHPLWVVAIAGLCVGGTMLLLPVTQRWLGALAHRFGVEVALFEAPPRATVVAIAWYVVAWLAIGTSTWAIARGIDAGGSWQGAVAATVVAWVAGFLAIPVPGGVGVREAIFVLAATELSSGQALAVATIARFVFVAVDGLGAIVAARSAASRPPPT